VVTTIALTAALLLGMAGVWRKDILRQAAGLWVVSDPLDHADAIVVLGGGLNIRPAAAAALFKQGIASEVLVPKSLYDNGREARLMRDVLVQSGVPTNAITEFDINLHSTYGEALAIAALAKTRKFKSLLIPTDLFPTRRTIWIFRHELGPAGVTVGVLAIVPPDYNLENWWRHKRCIRYLSSEILKYLYYRVVY
jgi:uncharacterized SAM-binding protein YcdF (DUF218 family)